MALCTSSMQPQHVATQEFGFWFEFNRMTLELKKVCRKKEESSSFIPSRSPRGDWQRPPYFKVLALGCLTLPRGPSLPWRSSGAPVRPWGPP